MIMFIIISFANWNKR